MFALANPPVPPDPQLVAAWLAAVIESSDDAIISKDLQGVITSWNQSAERIFGYTAEEMVGTPIRRLIPQHLQGEEAMILEKISRGERVEHFETHRLTKAGDLLDISVTVSPIRDGAGRVVGASKIARDITVLKAREREIAHLSRLYAALNQVNQTIVTALTQEELLRQVCQVLVGFGGFRLAWIGWHDPASRRLLPVAVWGDENDYIRSIQVYADERPEGRGPSGQAFRAGRPYICNNVLEDPSALAWRAEQSRRGLQASAVFPLRCRNAVCAILHVYADEPDFFQDKEIALLVEAAGAVSFALDNFRRNAERQVAEQRVEQEHEFSEAMLNSLPGVLYLYDRSGRFLRWNKNFEVVTGYTAAEIAMMHPLDFFAGPDRVRAAADFEETFASKEPGIEAGLVGKDGRVTTYFFTSAPTRFAGRECRLGIGIDITARKQAEEERRVSEARYRTLFDHAPDGILIADARSVYLDANTSMCRMLGYSHAELVGLHASDLIASDQHAQIEPAIAEIKPHVAHHREWQFRRKDGSIFPVEVLATLMPDGNLMGMIRDITDRQQAEAALREANATLEQKVAVRTEELSAALVRAEAADQIKSAFLATMSHELRTPLNSIIGFTGIVLQGLAGPLNAEQAKQLGMVRGSARHLLELINDVLDISKIEAGQLEVRPEPFDLPALIGRVIASVKPQADKKGLRLTTVLAPELGGMVNDRRRLEQILLNLLNNAIKFTEQGQVSLTAELLANFRSSPGATAVAAVCFRVSDTGIGIKPEDQAQLFQPFRQIDSGLTRQHEGTGLGLAICRRLAALMGGTITVASVWNEGSIFTVTLPLRRTP